MTRSTKEIQDARNLYDLWYRRHLAIRDFKAAENAAYAASTLDWVLGCDDAAPPGWDDPQETTQRLINEITRIRLESN